MAYKEYTHINARAFTRQIRKPKGITIHHWGNDGQTIHGAMAWHTREGANTSANYFTAAGVVYCTVDPDFISWANGQWQANVDNITIECRPEMSDGDFRTTAELIADIRRVYGNIPLNKHKDFYNTACPGRWSNQLGKLSALANEILVGEKVVNKLGKKLSDQPGYDLWRYNNPAYGNQDMHSVVQEIKADNKKILTNQTIILRKLEELAK